ncbi:MAG: PilZ domain-containing protein [Elusimicrobiota bacterium]|nr:PilZ domain-containing protein [Elusimicrobiota bacterium]
MKRILTTTDRRVAIRVLAGIPVKVRVKDLPDNIPASFSGETADLSSRGASLLLKNPLPVSSRISLTLDLAFPLPRLETDAKVLWNYFLPRDKKFNCGVQFLGLKKDYKRILEKFTKAKNSLGETVPERRGIERREGERRTTLIPEYDSNRRRVRNRRSFDRRQALMKRFFGKLTDSVLQLILLFKKKDIES